MKNIFDAKVTSEVVDRINKLSPETQPMWGKMSVDQMLAHCNVSYEMVYDTKHPKPNAFKRFMLKAIVKPYVVNDKPYKKNGRTAPEFVVSDEKDFHSEKERLINHLRKTQNLGEAYFDGMASHSFGKLSKEEWNNLFYKHIDHHLNQFGV